MSKVVTLVLPETGFLRLKHIIGDKKKKIPALIPVSATTWWNGCKSGRYPKPHELSPGCTAWKVEDIRKLIHDLGLDENAQQAA
jgi:prophage regulatory protein